MQKIILFLCAVLVIGKDIDSENINIFATTLVDHAELQYLKTLQNYDTRIECVNKNYMEGAGKTGDQIERLAATLADMDKFLSNRQLKSDFNEHCYMKYSSLIPSKHQITKNIISCMLDNKKQFTDMLVSLSLIRNSFHSYYAIDLQNEIKSCEQQYTKATANYSLCITSVLSKFTSFEISNKNNFNKKMTEAEYVARTNIEQVGDCSYAVQAQVFSELAEARFLIINCFEGKDECKPCPRGHICPSIYDLQVDYEMVRIPNPLLNHKNHNDCLMLRVTNRTN